MVPVNYWAVVIAAVVNFVLAWLWFGPMFGKTWMQLMGFGQADMDAAKAKGMTMSYALAAIGSLVMSWVLAHAVFFAADYFGEYSGMSSLAAGALTGFMSWLGFIGPVTMGVVLWQGKPWKLWWLQTGYYVITLLIMGAILGAWK